MDCGRWEFHFRLRFFAMPRRTISSLAVPFHEDCTMLRFGILAAAILAIAGVSNAHFVFVIPDAKDARKAVVVFSDELAPDANVSIDKVAGIKLQMRDAAGKDSTLTTVKAEHSLTVNLPGNGRRVVYGSVDFGVLQKGDSKPFLLRYHPKAIIGTAEGAKIGDKLPIEIVLTIKSGKVRFLVLAKGKPLADAEVNVIPADPTKKQKLMTDKEGYTSEIESKGRVGIWTRTSQAITGESGGKKYEEVRDYATLVVDFDAK